MRKKRATKHEDAMNAKLQAVEELKRFAVQLQGIMSLTDDLEKLGSMEQAVQEAESLVTQKQAEAQAMVAKVEDARAQIKEAEKEAAEIRNEAKMQAETLLANAKEGIEALQEKAEAEMAERRTEHFKQMEAFQHEHDRNREQLNELKTDIADRTKFLESLEKKIAALKAQFA